MKAEFKLEGLHRAVLVVSPEYGTEAMLAAAFIRYDSNVFSVHVERYENGQIKELTFIAAAE